MPNFMGGSSISIVLVVIFVRYTNLSRGSAASASLIFAVKYAFQLPWATVDLTIDFPARALRINRFFKWIKPATMPPTTPVALSRHEQWEVLRCSNGCSRWLR
jgi:hypothetical protein